ncbi:MAG: hypothetical protein LBN26_06815 [Christensenellaceae bacterium]|jgi:cell division protein FtsL|nr:hypothetical protein [Christensenellaceae bacterium]
MAIAARKQDSELRYAPTTRVYSYAAEPAAAPEAKPQGQTAPQGRPASAAHKKTRMAAPHKPGAQPQVSAGKALFTTLCVIACAGLLLMILVRYAMITQEYVKVNDLKETIAQTDLEIAALGVQLNTEVSFEEARAAALAAGMGYPMPEQIVHIANKDISPAGVALGPQ